MMSDLIFVAPYKALQSYGHTGYGEASDQERINFKY